MDGLSFRKLCDSTPRGDAAATLFSKIPQHGSVWFVQVQPTPADHLATSLNSTARQCVDRSSPAYASRPPRYFLESHSTAVCGLFKSSLHRRALAESVASGLVLINSCSPARMPARVESLRQH
jgi:hypothetical protein